MTSGAAPLLREICAAGSAAAAATVALARAKAESTRQDARVQASRERERAVLAHERAAARETSAARAEAAARVGRSTLAARAAALDRIFAEAERQLDALASHPGFSELIGAAILDGISYAPPGRAVVTCGERSAPAVRAALANAGLSAVQIRIDELVPAGATIESDDGAMTVDLTLAQRLRRARARLSALLAPRLAADPP